MPQNLFPYPGNKARHADWILNYLPDHECYVELFGGAAGVLFNKPKSKIEVYNDLNGDIPHFFRVLRDRGDELQEWLKNVPYSEKQHNEWGREYYDGLRPDDDIKRAGRFFFLRYTQFGGKFEGTSGFDSGFGTRNPSSQFTNSVNSLHTFRDRIRDVVITNRPALDIVERQNKQGTVFYADPPYEGTEGRYNSEGFDHQKLAEKAKEIDGKIIISYDSIPEFYDDSFTVVSKASNHAINSKGGNKESTEYLLMNFDPKEEPSFAAVEQETLF